MSGSTGRWRLSEAQRSGARAVVIAVSVFVAAVDRPPVRSEEVVLIEEGGGAEIIPPPEAAVRIREIIPQKYQKRYERWKREYLTTGAGKAQWARYSEDGNFTLTITVSKERGRGAQVTGFRWNDAGKLVAATINLGEDLDKGYPGPISYPVTSALALAESSLWRAPYISGEVLAATKLAHEFGHVNQTARTDMQRYLQLQEMITLYNAIIRSNGRNINDPKLRDLSGRMGGTPIEIWRDRELWAEANALRYLKERLPDRGEYRLIFRAIRRAINEYAHEHIELFKSTSGL